MSTYLELTQKLARQSGTVSGTGLPASVTGQTGRLLRCVEWLSMAWVQVQLQHRTWKFRRTEFSGAVLANTDEYTAASLSIDNLAEFCQGPTESDTHTIYEDALGVADERPLEFMEWPTFKRVYRRGTQTGNRPIHYSVAPSGALWLGPKPLTTYTLQGEYIRSAQVLEANGDMPICPADFHDVAVWWAMVYLAGFDEGTFQYANAKQHLDPLMRALARNQLPTITTSGSSLA